MRNALLFTNLGTVQRRLGKIDDAIDSYTLSLNITPYSVVKMCIRDSRNFEGRQGPGARTLLASPLVAAAAAVTGVITCLLYTSHGSLYRQNQID